MKSILVVSRNFPPLTGGMERLVHRSTIALAEEHTLVLIGPRGAGRFVPPGVRVIECPSGAIGFLIVASIRGFWHCLKNRYDCVFGGSGLVAPVVAVLARTCGAKSGLFVHGLDLVAASRVYQSVFVPFIRGTDFLIANSTNTRNIAADKGCNPTRIHVLHPGTDVPDTDRLPSADDVRKRLGLAAGRIVLSAGRIIPRKGLLPFIEHAWPTIVKQVPDCALVIVGDAADQAVDRKASAGTLAGAIASTELGDTIQHLGRVDDATLWACYGAADVLVFPLIDVAGDVEGFGMVSIEAAASGTPTVAFATGGVVDAVAEGTSGRLVEPGNYAAFCAGRRAGR